MAKIKKRGVLYTLSGFFLAGLVFTLSILTAITIDQSNQRLYESGGFERVIILDESLSEVMRNVDNGLTITMEETIESDMPVSKLSITESPGEYFSTFGSNFYSDLEDLESYVTTDQPEIKFDLTKISNETNKINLFIKPHNIEYTHVQDTSSNRTLIKVIPTGEMSHANFRINIESLAITDTHIIGWSPAVPGDFNFTLQVTDNFGFFESLRANLNETSNNTISVDVGSNTLYIYVSRDCLRCITLDSGNLNVTSTFESNLGYLGETATVNYPKGTYEINFTNIGIYVNKTPRIV